MTLFTSINEVLSPDVIARMADYVDEPTEKTHKAVWCLVYTIIGGLMKRTTSEIGVNQLYNHLQKGRYNGSLTDNLSAVLRDPGHTNTLITQGNDVISHLLPALKSSIGSMVSSYAGIRNSSAIALLGLTTTVVLHVLGRQSTQQKLDADGLAQSLFGQREAFVQAVPDDLMPRLVEKIGIGSVISGVAAPARRVSVETTPRPASASSGRSQPLKPVTTPAVARPPVSYLPDDDTGSDNGALGRWVIGALFVLVLAAAGYYVYQNTRRHANDGTPADGLTTVRTDTAQADTVARSLAVPTDSAARPTPKAAAAPTTTTLPTAASAATPASGLRARLTPYLGNPALPKGRVFSLTGVAYQPGSLSLTPGSQATVAELATLLKTYPTLQIQLIGYANDAVPPLNNKSLSFKRVNFIKQQLVTAGIDFVRVDAIGRGTGQGKPKLDSLGRAAPLRPALRKIDFKVVTK